jgi:hypothetical protein
MRNTYTLKSSSILIGFLFMSMALTPVFAGPVQPFTRWGYAYDNAGTPLASEDIYAWIDGQSYGINITEADGLFNLACYGDDTTPDDVKSGGYNGDTIFYTHGDLTATGTFFAETDTWIVGGYNIVSADLNEVASTPVLLKISVISISPMQYIGIHDPGATTLTNYGLDIGETGTFTTLNMGDVLGVIGSVTYFDAVPYGGLSAANSIQLAEMATGFVVDRVEYGVIATEPENTMMPNAPSPSAGWEIARVPSDDTDTNDCSIDFIVRPPPPPEPYIGSTDPFDGETNVEVNRDITVFFNKQMDTATLMFTCVPDPGGWIPSWSVGDTVLTLQHVDFMPFNFYTMQIWCDDVLGYPLVPGSVPNPWTFNTLVGFGSPTQIWVNKSSTDAVIEWSDGSPPFEVYISNNVDGSGFNFAVPDASGIMVDTWTHAGVLGDGNSYSYIVRGEGDPTNSEIGWKFAYQVQQPGNPNINWVSLPYVYEMATLGDLGTDIGNAITDQVRVWDVTAQVWRTILYSPIFGWQGNIGYALQPTDAVFVAATVAPGVWDICGAQASGLIVNIQQPGNPNINWVSMPYHHAYATLGALGPAIGNAITDQIRAWDVGVQVWRTILYSPIFGWTGDTGYALVPGDAVFIACTVAPGTWAPATNAIGP